jgi:hypothetical protein
MPITPVTAVLFDSPYTQAEYPILAARLRDTGSEETLHIVRPTAGPECDANSGESASPPADRLSVVAADPSASSSHLLHMYVRSLQGAGDRGAVLPHRRGGAAGLLRLPAAVLRQRHRGRVEGAALLRFGRCECARVLYCLSAGAVQWIIAVTLFIVGGDVLIFSTTY